MTDQTNNKLSPEQLIKKGIIQTLPAFYEEYSVPSLLTPEEVELAWGTAEKEDVLQDARNGFRDSGIETNLPAPFSRHYDCEIYARKIGEEWVAFPFWYGGGRHGAPEDMPWMEEAFFVDCTETEKLVVVREFKKKD